MIADVVFLMVVVYWRLLGEVFCFYCFVCLFSLLIHTRYALAVGSSGKKICTSVTNHASSDANSFVISIFVSLETTGFFLGISAYTYVQ